MTCIFLLQCSSHELILPVYVTLIHWRCYFLVKMSYFPTQFTYLSGNPRIIHRDIKSANILLDNNFEARVCSFLLSISEQFNMQVISVR